MNQPLAVPWQIDVTLIKSKSQKRARFFYPLGIGLFMLGVVGLSLLLLINQGLRLDEAQSLWQSSHSVAKIINIVAQDVHVPLYHLILHFWQIVFGTSIVATRILSLLFALAGIPLIYALGKLIYNRQIAFFATFLFAISPFLNWYANEIRMYSLLTLLTLINQYAFIQIYQGRKTKWWWVYGISAFLGIFTHYFFWLMLLSQAIFFLFNRNSFKPGTFKKLFRVGIILLITFIPWLYLVFSLGFLSNTEPLLVKPTSVNLFDTFFQFLFGFQNDQVSTTIVSFWPITVLLGFLTLRKNQSISKETIYLVLSTIFPILAAFLLSVSVRPLFLTRYLIFTIPAFYLVLSWVLSTYGKSLSRTFKILLVFLMLSFLTIEVKSESTPVKENYLGAAEYLTSQARPQDVIAVSAPFTIYPFEYYYQGNARVLTFPFWNRFQVGPIPTFDQNVFANQVNSLTPVYERLWVILSFDQGYEEDIRLYLDSHYQRLEEKNFSPGVNLYLYQLRYD